MRKKLSRVRTSLITQSEKRHGTFHLLFGLLAYFIGYLNEPDFFAKHEVSLLFTAILASYLPDIDHLFYIFTYGRKKDYAKAARNLLVKKDVKGFIRYVKQEHKHNTGIYSHNFGSLLLALFFTSYMLNTRENIQMFVFFLAGAFHYLYDILEDILFFKRPNKNWFFIFNKN